MKKGGKWAFDAEAGREEVTNRRVGRNELDTIQTLLAIVDAQREYAAADADGNGFADYARALHLDAGQEGRPLLARRRRASRRAPSGRWWRRRRARATRARPSRQPQPYHGYHYRILTGQGKDAPGGAYDYLVKDKLIGGFAVVAYPAKLRRLRRDDASSSTTTACVYEKDLGARRRHRPRR